MAWPLPGVAAAARLQPTPGPDGHRAAVGTGAVGLGLLVSIGLALVAVEAVSGGRTLGPQDAQGSAPWSWPALVAVAVVVVGTVVAGRRAKGRRGPVGAVVPFAVVAVVVVTTVVAVGSTDRIDVPRPGGVSSGGRAPGS